jgi:hypothetical protein
MKGDFIEMRTFPLPQRKVYLSRYRALLIDRTLERFGQCGGVEGGSGGRQVCLLGFSHTMNQVKVSTDDHDERNLYGGGDPQSDERAREHAPARAFHFLAFFAFFISQASII